VRHLALPVLAVMAAAVASGQDVGTWRHIDDSSTRYAAAATMAPDGRFVVAWQPRECNNRGPVRVQLFDAAGGPRGPAIDVGDPICYAYGGLGPGEMPSLGGDGAGNFIVVWPQPSSQPGDGLDLVARRFDADGVQRGAEFRVNTTLAGPQFSPALAVNADGESVVVWASRDGSLGGVYGQSFDAAGGPRGAEFRVNATTADAQADPAVALSPQGQALVVWHSRGQDGSQEGIFARRFDRDGAALGAEMAVNTFTTGHQMFPAVAALADGGFVVAWPSTEGDDGSGPGIFARRYDASGAAAAPEFRVARSSVWLGPRQCALVAEGQGFTVAWSGGPGLVSTPMYDARKITVRRYDPSGQPVGPALDAVLSDVLRAPAVGSDGAGRLVLVGVGTSPPYSAGFTRRFGAAWPVSMRVDERPGPSSDRNGVLDPGEVVVVEPAWHNSGLVTSALAGIATAFTGPGGPDNPTYDIVAGTADYGNVPSGQAGSCTPATGCYALGVGLASPRPRQHIDATFTERLTAVPGEVASRKWSLHVGGSFDDVPRTSPYYRFVETLMHFSISGGCSATSYCPDRLASRRQLAPLLLRARLGGEYEAPRPAMGVFTDVAPSDPAAPWMEDLWNRAIVEGCGLAQYCPDDAVTREQVAVTLLRAVEGPSYVPPACTTPAFSDVPCSDPYARWVNALAARGITAGCAPGLFCPLGPVTRGQLAVLITTAFGLDLHAPALIKDPLGP